MSSSNLPRLWGLVTAACTYEGENTVLQLQVGIYRGAVEGKTGKATERGIGSHCGCSCHGGLTLQLKFFVILSSASMLGWANKDLG